MSTTGPPLDVLVVGAGPTGLALAAQVHAHGGSVRIVDRNADRVHESRALAVQPRTLEVLTSLDLASTLVARGNPAVQLRLHAEGRDLSLPLFDLGMSDTDYPFLLFVSQAVTEQVLVEHLAGRGVAVEREVTLVGCEDTGEQVRCELRDRDGGVEEVSARYLAGCDGARSTVRELAGIRFVGDPYPQVFALADLEVDGLEPDLVHAYLTAGGPLFFFPLGEPASWRMITMRSPGDVDGDATLDDLRMAVRAVAGDRLRLRDPVWLTDFRLQRRQAARYRAGRLFLAGDAAHVHSPAGAQGMNTGIQDAWNLGWKLALVARGAADPALLETYHTERAPVGRTVVRFTDRAFRVATSAGPLIRLVRTRLVPRLLPLLGRLPRLRAAAFRTIAELSIDYRGSAGVQEGRPAPRSGPRAGDRLPSGQFIVDGDRRSLHEALAGPGFQLLLCGPPDRWPAGQVEELAHRYAGLLSVRKAERLGGPANSHFLVRPDGHVGYRAGGTDLAGLGDYLRRWLPRVG